LLHLLDGCVEQRRLELINRDLGVLARKVELGFDESHDLTLRKENKIGK